MFAQAVRPWRGLTRRGRQLDPNPLVTLRITFLSLVISIWMFAFVIYVGNISAVSRSPDQPAFDIVLAAGVACLAFIEFLRSRPLDVTDPSHLANSFRAKTFIGIGYAEIPAAVALVMVWLGHHQWLYLVGAAISTVGLLLVAPSRREIARRQEQIERSGSSLSLGAALTRPPRPDR